MPRSSTSIGSANQFFKRLIESELKAKKDKGLCFHCDEKYPIGHKCKNRELQVLLVCDEERQDEWVVEESAEEVIGEEKSMAGEMVELSMNSMVGLTPPRTMKVKRKNFRGGSSSVNRLWS